MVHFRGCGSAWVIFNESNRNLTINFECLGGCFNFGPLICGFEYFNLFEVGRLCSIFSQNPQETIIITLEEEFEIDEPFSRFIIYKYKHHVAGLT